MDPSALEDLIAVFIARRSDGEALEPARFAAEHPGGGAALRAALEGVLEAERLLPGRGDLPERLGPYRVMGIAGRGGMGIVLRGEHEVDRMPAALKVLAGGVLAEPRARQRFRREGEALARLCHPNIVRVLDVGGEGPLPWFAMEWVEGRNLGEAIAAHRDGGGARAERSASPDLPLGPARAGEAAALVARLARAVDAAHGAGLLHRDLKPKNVIVRADGEPVLLDFGLVGDAGEPTLTGTGDVIGTPASMAPEQARGLRADPRTDVYGLGAILYEMLALRSPHPGDSVLSTIERVRREPAPPLARVAAGTPLPLARVVDRALSYRRARRHASAAALAADLEAFAAGGAPLTPRFARLHRIEDAARRHRRILATFAILALLVAIGVLVDGVREQREESARASHRRTLDRAASALVAGDGGALAAAAEDLLRTAGHDDAEAKFLAAAAHGVDSPDVADPVARALLDAERARRDRRFGDAILLLRSVQEQLPASPLPAVLLGRAARQAGRLDLAETELTFAARRLPSSSAVSRLLGRVLCDRRRPGEALPHLRRAVLLDRTSVEAHTELVRALYQAGEIDEGLATAREAVGVLGMRGADVLNAYGALLDRSGRREDARALFDEILATQPDHVAARFNRAYSLDCDHRLLEAEREYQAVLARDPRRADADATLAWLYVGSCADPTCERPHVIEPEKAALHAITALESDRGKGSGAVPTAVEVMLRLGRAAELADVLDRLIPTAASPEAELRLRQFLERARAAAVTPAKH